MKTVSMLILVSMISAFALLVGARADSHSESAPHGCGPGNVTAKFRGVSIHYSCFGGEGFTRSEKPLFGEKIMIFANAKMARRSDSLAMRILFSADPGCRFAKGVTMKLGNPCLMITDSSTLTLPPGTFGFRSGCSWKGHREALSPGCALNAADKTLGSILITRWPSISPIHGSGVVAFRFSPDSEVTGLYAKRAAGHNWFYPKFFPVAVPLTGSARMKIDY